MWLDVELIKFPLIMAWVSSGIWRRLCKLLVSCPGKGCLSKLVHYGNYLLHDLLSGNPMGILHTGISLSWKWVDLWYVCARVHVVAVNNSGGCVFINSVVEMYTACLPCAEGVLGWAGTRWFHVSKNLARPLVNQDMNGISCQLLR